jgi:hypothetical protein
MPQSQGELICPSGSHTVCNRSYDGVSCRSSYAARKRRRHCEELLRRSNPAFVGQQRKLDCFAALAMTADYAKAKPSYALIGKAWRGFAFPDFAGRNHFLLCRMAQLALPLKPSLPATNAERLHK